MEKELNCSYHNTALPDNLNCDEWHPKMFHRTTLYSGEFLCFACLHCTDETIEQILERHKKFNELIKEEERQKEIIELKRKAYLL
jgi:hypothetical protein